MIRTATAALVAITGCLLAAPGASAHGVITKQGTVLTFTATNNCQPVACPSTLVITTPETGIVQFEDDTSKGGIFWGPCEPVNERRTRCDSTGVTRIDVLFDGNDDSASIQTAIPVHAVGAGGNDTIAGGFGADLIEGGPGDDAITGNAASDDLRGDSGNDTINARDGLPDNIDCADGIDIVSADQTDPTDLTAVHGCETVSVAAQAPPPPPPDTPPDTRLTKRPPRATHHRSASFRFRASEPGSSFECSRDASPYRPCSKGRKRLRGLRRGRHVFKVRATDPAGNTDPTPAVYHWRVKR